LARQLDLYYISEDCTPDAFPQFRDLLASLLTARGVDPDTLVVDTQLQLFSPNLTVTVKGQRKKTHNA
jgi:hypothetical protein